jgi:hypothetical protein
MPKADVIEWLQRTWDDYVDTQRALAFYADPRRYEGSNKPPIPGDEFQPPEMPYRLDVYRDGGEIARKTIQTRS